MICVQITFYNCTYYKLVVDITFSIMWLLCIQQPFVGPYKHLLKNVPLKYVEKGAFQIFILTLKYKLTIPGSAKQKILKPKMCI